MIVLAFQIQLVPDGSLLIHITLILLMIWILNRTFFRPINKVLESRSKNSGGRNIEAQEILNQVQDKNTTYDSAIRESRNEGYELVEKQRAKAVAKRQKKIDSVKEEVATLLATEKGTIVEQTEQARKEINKEAKKLAEKISSNLLKA
jgi:F0F1-type ATP synthase membrane subunit b/b'